MLKYPFIVAVLICLVGCSGKSDRKDVYGTITWKGKPIPEGIIHFTPDVRKGNDGPQGIAFIKDGKFDTRFEKSRGCVKGPQLAKVNACDGKDVGQFKPFGNLMFKNPPVISIEIPDDGGEVNIIIPESTTPSVPSADAEPL